MPEPIDFTQRAMTDAEIAAGPPWHSRDDVDRAPKAVVLILHSQRIGFSACICPFCDGSLQGFEANG